MNGDRTGLHPGALVAAILLPPLGVWLVDGVGATFWICFALTCIAFLPGMLFALVAVLSPGTRDRIAARFA